MNFILALLTYGFIVNDFDLKSISLITYLYYQFHLDQSKMLFYRE